MLQVAEINQENPIALEKNNKHKVKQLAFMAEFACDSSKCINHCCEYATIRVDQDCVDLYTKKAPKLLDAMEKHNGHFRMKTKDGVCKQMNDKGLCSIQCEYGIDYQPQICHTYPRDFSLFDKQWFVTSSFPCSEMLRSALFTENAFSWVEADIARVPVNAVDKLKKGPFQGTDKQKLLEVYEAVLQFIDHGRYDSEKILLRLLALGELFEEVRQSDYPVIIQHITQIANHRNLDAIYQRFEKTNLPILMDLYIHSLLATTKNYRKKEYNETVGNIAGLVDKLDKTARRDIYQNKIANAELDALLKRYIKARVSQIIFPLSNWGACVDDLLFLLWGYVGIRLAFIQGMDELDKGNNQDKVVRIIYDFERVLYHGKGDIKQYFKKRDLLYFDQLTQLLLA